MSVFRVALKAVVETALSQGAWIWVSAARQRRQKKTEPARLEDFKMFDEASRGLWGSIVLVWRMKGVHFACIGAGIVILIHGFETFSSQMVQTENRRQLLGNTTTPPLARSETWNNVEQTALGPDTTLGLSTKAAVYSGFMASRTSQLPVTCGATNCTWPVFPSLAVCGSCSQSLYRQSCILNGGCTYTMASGTSLSVGAADTESHFTVAPSNGSANTSDSNSQAYFSFFDIMTANKSTTTTQVEAYQCALWFCLQSYNVSMTSGHQSTTVVESWSKAQFARWNNAHDDEYVFVDIPRTMNVSNNARYHVGTLEIRVLKGFMDSLTRGETSTVAGKSEYSSDWIQALANGSNDLNNWMSNLTLSITNDIRLSGTIYNKASVNQYAGSAYDMAPFVKVNWTWVIYPLVLMVFAFAYLVQTVWRTARDQVAAWKGDALPMLFAHIDKGIQRVVRDGMDVPEGLNDRIGRTEVELVRKENGQWVFKLLPHEWDSGADVRDVRDIEVQGRRVTA